MNHSAFVLAIVLTALPLLARAGDLSNPTLTTIFQRKSVRHFTAGKVSKEQLEMLVRAGMAAPTAVDRRPWEFIIVTKRETLDRLADEMPYARMAKQAQAGIIVLGDVEKQFGGKKSLYWIMDCSAASQNILLAAESMKLGAVWTAVYPDEERVRTVRKLFKIPSDKIPLNFIPVGIPDGTEKPKDKYNPAQIHWNGW